MATTADPQGYPVGRWIACVFHILTHALWANSCTKVTLNLTCALSR